MYFLSSSQETNVLMFFPFLSVHVILLALYVKYCILLSLIHWVYELKVEVSLTQKIASANDSMNYLDNVKI